MKLITLEELDQLKEVREKATAGYWYNEYEGEVSVRAPDEADMEDNLYSIARVGNSDQGDVQAELDSAYIAHVNPESMERLELTLRKAIEVMSSLTGAASDCLVNDSEERDEAIHSMRQDIKNARNFLASIAPKEDV